MTFKSSPNGDKSPNLVTLPPSSLTYLSCYAKSLRRSRSLVRFSWKSNFWNNDRRCLHFTSLHFASLHFSQSILRWIADKRRCSEPML